MPEILDRDALKALSTNTRQEIIKLLAKRPYTASELSKILDKHVTTIAEHLELLEKSGLIRRKNNSNKWVYYVLSDKGQKIFKPVYYSWIIIFSLSIICLFGIYSVLNIPKFSEATYIEANEVIVDDKEIGATAGIATAIPVEDKNGTKLGFIIINKTNRIIDTTLFGIKKGSQVEISKSGEVLVDDKEVGITTGIATAIPVITKKGEMGTIVADKYGLIINSTISSIKEGSRITIGKTRVIIIAKK